ncbi:hypothetical protein Maq22A_c28680 [Methylobacterium aquaticum]|uniref:Uncharacterized protein n=1 Tax=Methylobacterium aquaticum TaxID=270351 RepID=A0A1Y0ZCB5_9HYPH|nr:hypothetical protein Maq22A_c28680 [Methylobacterium aquaticum]
MRKPASHERGAAAAPPLGPVTRLRASAAGVSPHTRIRKGLVAGKAELPARNAPQTERRSGGPCADDRPAVRQASPATWTAPQATPAWAAHGRAGRGRRRGPSAAAPPRYARAIGANYRRPSEPFRPIDILYPTGNLILRCWRSEIAPEQRSDNLEDDPEISKIIGSLLRGSAIFDRPHFRMRWRAG